MNGRIDKQGCLWIERAGVMKRQFCPRQDDTLACGDWCPLFGEPYEMRGPVQMGTMPTPAKTLLNICQNRTLVFDMFTDERGKRE